MKTRRIVILMLALGASSCGWQNRYVYYPSPEVVATPREEGLRYEEVTFEASDGVRLSAWWVPADQPRAVVIFCHGNAGNISDRTATLRMLHDLGLSTFIFDYRGFGRSAGQPSEEGTYRDAEGAWRYVTQVRGVGAERIILFGRSLGGAVAAHLASEHPPRALVLESTFTSIGEVAREQSALLSIAAVGAAKYPTVKVLPTIHVPVLVVHSREDRTIPFSHGERLFEVANEPKTFLEIRGDHNSGWQVSGKHYRDGLGTFIEKVVRMHGDAGGD